MTAMSVPWPRPVKASDPNNSHVTPVGAPHSTAERAKSAAARMGPTVCELDGPIPIVNKSITLNGGDGFAFATEDGPAMLAIA
jgi:hypothetical protein